MNGVTDVKIVSAALGSKAFQSFRRIVAGLALCRAHPCMTPRLPSASRSQILPESLQSVRNRAHLFSPQFPSSTPRFIAFATFSLVFFAKAVAAAAFFSASAISANSAGKVDAAINFLASAKR
jgi:hypothetical protein